MELPEPKPQGRDDPAPSPQTQSGTQTRRPSHEPIFNLPAIVTAFAGLLVAIHLIFAYALSPDAHTEAMILFSFIPARYAEAGAGLPVHAAALWSPLTYSFLHGSWGHLLMNLAWLVAFASPVARRFGPARTVVLATLASLGGALAHYLAFPGELVPVIGASAIVAGFMGAASRFVFSAPGGFARHDLPAQKLSAVLTNPGFLAFVGIWLVLNYVFGSGLAPIAGENVQVAWQAHVGGFVAGLAGFSLLERR